MIRAGRMRDTITIERPSGTRGTLGQTQYETFETARAEVDPMTREGRELSGPQMAGSESLVIFRTRYIPGVKANMRVVLSPTNRIFLIQYVITKTEGNTRFLDIFAREVMSA